MHITPPHLQKLNEAPIGELDEDNAAQLTEWKTYPAFPTILGSMVISGPVAVAPAIPVIPVDHTIPAVPATPCSCLRLYVWLFCLQILEDSDEVHYNKELLRRKLHRSSPP